MTTVAAWASIPRKLRRAIAPISARELSWRGGSEGLSIREYVHHLVEANIVASTITLAALGHSGCEFDWSWMFPDSRWMKGLGYDRAPLDPALKLLEALCSHVAGLVKALPDAMKRHVRLIDSPGARPRRQTVERVLKDELEHARHHLRDIADTKKLQGRKRVRVRSN